MLGVQEQLCSNVLVSTRGGRAYRNASQTLPQAPPKLLPMFPIFASDQFRSIRTFFTRPISRYSRKRE